MPAPSIASVIQAARDHAANGIQADSAKFCLRDAEAQYKAGNDLFAARHALKSLAYSVGVFHAAHKDAKARVEALAIYEHHSEEFRAGFDSVDDEDDSE